MGEAVLANLKAHDKQDREASRGIRRTMKERINYGKVVDSDVRKCI